MIAKKKTHLVLLNRVEHNRWGEKKPVNNKQKQLTTTTTIITENAHDMHQAHWWVKMGKKKQHIFVF